MNKEMQMTIGLEIHVQVNTLSKLFSNSKAEGCDEPNTNISCFDMAMPGVIPRLNHQILEKAVQATLAIDGTVNKYSRFDRKHYFYPDSPFNYQITQLYHPICSGGYIDIGHKKIHIHHFHIESDAGKMSHSGKHSYLDFNRVGIPLFEIVTQPEIKSPEEFKKFVQEIILRLEYADVGNCNMELGNFRIDVNISVSKDANKLGNRVEIKNLNSIKFAIEAINYEYARQVETLSNGGTISQETRGFNSDLGETFIMRTKENELDYRYVPDYNIAPIELDDSFIDIIKKKMPEMPHQRRIRYDYLGDDTKEVLISDKKLGDYFDLACAETSNHSMIANLITTDLMGLCKKEGMMPYNSKVLPHHLSIIGKLHIQNKISTKIAKTLVEKVFETGRDPKEIVETEGLVKITDVDTINSFISEALTENPNEVSRYKNGDEKLLMFFLGKVIKSSRNRADPVLTQMLLKEVLLK
jgi:aspartyl-tRNA(Asn)/glutamyl-tRNA(Gln) amidotransferase subunit B